MRANNGRKFGCLVPENIDPVLWNADYANRCIVGYGVNYIIGLFMFLLSIELGMEWKLQ